MTYFLKLKNKGPSDSTGMTISDQLPPEVRFRKVTPSQGSCSIIESGSTTITCAPGTIAAGSFATVAITVFVPSFVEPGVTISNRACVFGQKEDPISTNDCSTARAVVIDRSDLEVKKTIPPGPVFAGTNIEYTLEVHNKGPSDARGVILGDSLPAGVILVSAKATQGTCNALNPVVCDIGYVAVNKSAFVTIIAFVPSNTPDGTIITNTACIQKCGHDLFPNNDCGSVSFTVGPQGKLAGNVYEDHSGDTLRNGGDQGLQSWTVYLDDNGNSILDSGERQTLTDAIGNYTFTGLGPSTYRVREVLKGGWKQTTANPSSVYLSGQNETFAGGDFGNFDLIDIAGQVFHDFNRNAVKEPGEPGLGVWTVYVDSNSNNRLDSGELQTLSDAAGNYKFTNLGPGSYAIREVLMPGWTQTTPNPLPIVASSGIDRTGIDFGNARAGVPAKITGGGSIDQSVRNFGFVVIPKIQAGTTSITGNLEFQDKSLGYNLKAVEITTVNVEPDRIHGQISGTATLNGVAGYRFFVELEDIAEPGALVDKFRIRISGPNGFRYDSNVYAVRGGVLDKGGNIQIHKAAAALMAHGNRAAIESTTVEFTTVLAETETGDFLHKTNQLQSGVYTVSMVERAGAMIGAQRLRVQDAIASLNEKFNSYGILLTVAPLGGESSIRIAIVNDSECGDALAGVLGCTEDENEISILSGWDWYTGGDPSQVGQQQFDFQTVVMHELGHAIGLNHSNESSSVMYESLAPGLARRTLSSLDFPPNREREVGGQSFAITAVPPLPIRLYTTSTLWLADGVLLRDPENRHNFLSEYSAYGIGLSLEGNGSHNHLVEEVHSKRFVGDEVSEVSFTSNSEEGLSGDDLSVYEAALLDILAAWDSKAAPKRYASVA